MMLSIKYKLLHSKVCNKFNVQNLRLYFCFPCSLDFLFDKLGFLYVEILYWCSPIEMVWM